MPTSSPQRWYRRLAIRVPRVAAANPAPNRADALARLEALRALDEGLPEATHTLLLEPQRPIGPTIVLWHGFTNAPSQFGPAAERLQAMGYRVLVPRMPRHGLADVLNRDLAALTEAELCTHAEDVIDIAAGLGSDVWVVGLSAGGVLAAWAAATRAEVSRLLLIAPLIGPKGFPMPAVRLAVKFPKLIPNFYLWWDPRLKANLGHSPYAYPGFPLPGVIRFLHLSESMFDGSVPAAHRLERAVLVTNPSDLAVRADAATEFAARVFKPDADFYAHLSVERGLKWTHDFVDPWSPDGATPDQVVAVLAAGLGVGDPSAHELLGTAD